MNHPQDNNAPQSSNKTFLLCTFTGMICIVMGATLFKDSSSNILEGIDLHIGRMVSNIGVVLVFIKLIDAFFYRPLSDAINQRNCEIEEAYTQAEKLRSQMKQLKTDYEKQLIETDTKVKTQLQKQMKETLHLRENILEESHQKAKEILKQAEEEIQSYRSTTLKELKIQTIDLTLKATEKIILKNVNDEVNRNLIKEFVDQLEVKKI